MANLASYSALSGLLGSRNRKQASAAGSSNYDSQAPRSGSLHGTSNSWGAESFREHPGRQDRAVSGSWDSKPLREHPGRDQASPVGNSWGGKWSEDYPARDQDRFAGAPADERLYVASKAGRGPEKMADFRGPDYISEQGMGDLTRYVQGNSAPQGSMAGLAAGGPSVTGGRHGVGMSPTNPFASRGSHGSFITDSRVLGFAGPSLPIGKGDSIDPSRENDGKASSGKEHVDSPFAPLLAMEFAAVVAKIPVKGELSEALLKSVVTSSVSSGSIGSFQARSSFSGDSVGSDLFRAHESAISASEREQQAALEDTFAADTSHIVMHDLGTSGLRASVSTAPSEYCVEALRDIEYLKIQLAKSQLDHENCKMDLEQSELKLQKYNGEVEAYVGEVAAEILRWKTRMFDLSLESADALETVLNTQEKLIEKIRDQQCSLEASSLLLKKREEQIEELLRANAQLVDVDRAGFPRNGEWVPVGNPGEKLYIQRNVSLDVIKAMGILDKELLTKKLEEEKLKREIEEEILAEIFARTVVQVVPEVFAEICKEIGEVPRQVVEEAGAGPVAQKLQAESSPKEEKPSHEYVIEHLKKQSYSPDAFTRILEDDSVVKDLEKYPFFQAVFSSQALKQNLPRFCEDILHEADKLYGRKLNIGNAALLSMLKVILLERKPFSLESLRNFRVNGVFHNSCIPTGKPSENLDAFDDTAMSFHNDTKTFFKYFVTVYVSWKTDASDLFVELVAKIRDDK